MAVTRLERKGRKNKSVAKRKTDNIKRLSASPVIKKVDVEAIKAEFAANSKKGKKKAAKKEEAPEAPAAEKEETSAE